MTTDVFSKTTCKNSGAFDEEKKKNTKSSLSVVLHSALQLLFHKTETVIHKNSHNTTLQADLCNQ